MIENNKNRIAAKHAYVHFKENKNNVQFVLTQWIMHYLDTNLVVNAFARNRINF